MTDTLTDLTPTVENVLAVFDNAFPEQIEAGMTWYDDANLAARILSPDDICKGAGVIAVLSPRLKWIPNLYQATRAFNGRRHVGLGLSVRKANAILDGADPITVIGPGSPKVMSFYLSILNPDGDIDPVIDRHAFDIAVGRQTSDAERAILSRKTVYAEFVRVYREAAQLRNVGPKKMQAVTWVAWREAIGISD